ncbi:MAG TPA: ATP-binding protein [Acidimicrobiales bacterium]|nr:ATP-binding protein [Acidimicrobiales bacterium]
MRNPLAAATNGLYLTRLSLGNVISAETDRHLSIIERETGRAASLSDDLVAYMRERAPEPIARSVRRVVDEVLQATPPPPGIDVSVEIGPLTLEADAAQLTQMLANLVTNAYQARTDGGTLAISAAQEGDFTTIALDDNGPGIDPAAAGRLFEPFFTTKAQGTGLGLSIVQRLAQAHGGDISIENRPDGGARVNLRLPTAAIGAET